MRLSFFVCLRLLLPPARPGGGAGGAAGIRFIALGGRGGALSTSAGSGGASASRFANSSRVNGTSLPTGCTLSGGGCLLNISY